MTVQAAATWFMTGLITFVQVVHYPLFGRVGGEGFKAYQADHVRRTTWVVAPPMLVEAACAIATVVRPPAGVPTWQAWTGLGLLGMAWASTAWLQVPQHRRLEAGFDRKTHRTLVATNGLRVATWWARAMLVGVWVAAAGS